MAQVPTKHKQVSPQDSHVAKLMKELPCENSTTQLPAIGFSNISSPVNFTENKKSTIPNDHVSGTSSNETFAVIHDNSDTTDLPTQRIEFHRYGFIVGFFVAMATF
ncbi:hypothetical protein DFH28DRAFT_912360 [Melampsora americana]|nr:hypothetical protein DFH28DRAFT_912360 [Melampsora americana]